MNLSEELKKSYDKLKPDDIQNLAILDKKEIENRIRKLADLIK